MNGVELIAKERQEQIEKHGHTLENDLVYDGCELIDAAVVCASECLIYQKHEYANEIHFKVLEMPGWNLPVRYKGNVLLDNYKSSNKQRIHQLKVAGALIAAEIDRLQAIE